MHPSIPESMYTQFLSARSTPSKNGTLTMKYPMYIFTNPALARHL